jgi:hypothetical protein
LSGWTDRPASPGYAEAGGAWAAVRRRDLLDHVVLATGRSQYTPLSLLVDGLDGLDERIGFLVTRVEELLNRKGRVALRIDDQTAQAPALRVEVGRNEPRSIAIKSM